MKTITSKFVELNNKTKTEEGFISVETLIVAGLMLGLGILGLVAFKDTVDPVTEKSLDQVGNAMDMF